MRRRRRRTNDHGLHEDYEGLVYQGKDIASLLGVNKSTSATSKFPTLYECAHRFASHDEKISHQQRQIPKEREVAIDKEPYGACRSGATPYVLDFVR